MPGDEQSDEQMSPSEAASRQFHGDQPRGFQRRGSRARFDRGDVKGDPRQPGQVPDVLRERLSYMSEHGHPPVKVRMTSTTMDESTFASLVRIDTILSLRQRLGDDKFVLDQIEHIFRSNFSDRVSD